MLILTELSAQTYFEMNDGKSFFADVGKETADSFSCEKDDRIIQIPKSQIKLIETEEGGVTVFSKEKIQKINTANYEGLLYAEGNNVYVPYSSTKIIVRSGSKTLRELLKADGFWNIVGCEEEAHCIFEYAIDYSGKDKAFFTIKDREGRELWKSRLVSARDFIPSHAGQESAERLYKSEIKKLKKELQNQ